MATSSGKNTTSTAASAAGISMTTTAAPPPTMEVAAEVPFHVICSLMEQVWGVGGVERKKKIFSSFLKKWREEHKRLHPSDGDTTVREREGREGEREREG